MSFSLTSVSPDRISEDGGHEIVISGIFEIGHRYLAFIGDVGGTLDHPCYSGKPGQRNYLYLQADGTLKCYTPRLPPGMTLSITVKDGDSAESHKLESSITTTYQDFHTTVFKIRKVLPVFYKTGARDIEQIGPI